MSILIALACLSVEGKPILAVNEDNDHFFKLDVSRMTRKGLEAYIDSVARGHVTHFFMCVNGQRTSYDSKTWEPIWMGIDEPAHPSSGTATAADGTHDIWAVNAKRLFDAGIDPYEVWTTCCRKKGVSPWISMRMNDVHFANISNYFRNTTFCRTRRDLWRVPNEQSGSWDSRSLDYAQKEVRDYSFAQFKEIAWRWDSDGVELDWMRFGYNLKPGREKEDAHHITAFVRDARRELDAVSKAKGRRLQLAVRVPRSPEAALEVGLDVGEWVKEGIVDLVIASSFLYADFDIPVAAWIAFLNARNPSVAFLPCADSLGQPGVKGGEMTMANYRAIAERFYRGGAKGIYLFNAPYVGSLDSERRQHKEDTFALVCTEGLAPNAIAGKPREYLNTRPDFPRGKPAVPLVWKTHAGEEYELVWNDEFDGQSFDPKKWDIPVQWRQKASLWHPSNVVLTNGVAHFDIKANSSKAICYESACLRTLKRKVFKWEEEKPLFTFTYGYSEIRCRLPERWDGDYWAAFWLQGVEMGRCGTDSREGMEVDVLETQTRSLKEGTCWISLHWGGYKEDHAWLTLKPKYPPLHDSGWHVFGCFWTEKEYVFYLDGCEIARTDLVSEDLSHLPPGKAKPLGTLQKPAYIKLSCEAAPWCGATGDYDNGAKCDTFEVDYVRVYQRRTQNKSRVLTLDK